MYTKPFTATSDPPKSPKHQMNSTLVLSVIRIRMSKFPHTPCISQPAHLDEGTYNILHSFNSHTLHGNTHVWWNCSLIYILTLYMLSHAIPGGPSGCYMISKRGRTDPMNLYALMVNFQKPWTCWIIYFQADFLESWLNGCNIMRLTTPRCHEIHP